MNRVLFAPIIATLLSISQAYADNAVAPLVRGHSHNDYVHDKPLIDALDHGIWSVEADIFLIDGELRVAHDRPDTKPGVTLEKLYLDPLLERFRAGEGLSKDGPEFTLLIDIKDHGEKTYAHLREVLKNYDEMLTSYGEDGVTKSAVVVVISGNRPIRMLAEEKERLAFLDGRLNNVGKDDPSLYPLVSMSWGSVFKWRGKDEMPEEERARLDDLVSRAHAKGQRVRFWALPLSKNVWPVIYDAGVDLINADHLDKLREFLLAQEGEG